MKRDEISGEELNSIIFRCEKATLGSWISFVEGRDHTSVSNFIMTGVAGIRGEEIELIGTIIEDQNFIANARQEIPMLLNEIERLKRKVQLISVK